MYSGYGWVRVSAEIETVRNFSFVEIVWYSAKAKSCNFLLVGVRF